MYRTKSRMLRGLQVVGNALRESARAVEAVGGFVAESVNHLEPLSRHRTLMSLYNRSPRVKDSAFVAPSASVQGDVSLAENASVWYGAIVRGQSNAVSIGEKSSIQDGAIVTSSDADNGANTVIGNNVTVAQGSIIDQCRIGDDVLIGARATINKNVTINSFSIINPGSLVVEGTVVPSGQMWGGSPAQKVRDLTPQEKETIAKIATDISSRASLHSAVNDRPWHEIAATVPKRVIDSPRNFDREKQLGVAPDSQRSSW